MIWRVKNLCQSRNWHVCIWNQTGGVKTHLFSHHLQWVIGNSQSFLFWEQGGFWTFIVFFYVCNSTVLQGKTEKELEEQHSKGVASWFLGASCTRGLGNNRVSKILHTHLFGSGLVHFSRLRFDSQLWEAGIPVVALAAKISSWQMGFFYPRNGISSERVNERKEGVLFSTDCLKSLWHSSEVLRADINKRLG